MQENTVQKFKLNQLMSHKLLSIDRQSNLVQDVVA